MSQFSACECTACRRPGTEGIETSHADQPPATQEHAFGLLPDTRENSAGMGLD